MKCLICVPHLFCWNNFLCEMLNAWLLSCLVTECFFPRWHYTLLFKTLLDQDYYLGDCLRRFACLETNSTVCSLPDKVDLYSSQFCLTIHQVIFLTFMMFKSLKEKSNIYLFRQWMRSTPWPELWSSTGSGYSILQLIRSSMLFGTDTSGTDTCFYKLYM